MRDRKQRLNWIENLIGTSYRETERDNALVIPTSSGDMAIAFASIVEVVPASRVQPLALLPDEFCGVLHRGNDLVPVVDTGGRGASQGHVVLTEGRGCPIGFKFSGTPSVVNLDETEYAALAIERRPAIPADAIPLLDIDAVVDALLGLD